VGIAFDLFPKALRGLEPAALAGLIRETGLDSTALVVREGFWAEPATVGRDARRFTDAMRREGVRVEFAVTDFAVADLARDAAPLEALAAAGIRGFRPRFEPKPGDGDVRGALDGLRSSLERLAPRCEDLGVRASYQLHHNMLVSSPSGVWPLVKGLPAEAVGVMIDPGNQAREGMEDWDRSCRLLGEYVATAGVKDVAITRRPEAPGPEEGPRPDKGWRRSWAPVDEGVTNWHHVVTALSGVGFAGRFVFMPFYREDDPRGMRTALAGEVAYIRGVLSEVSAE
jgi:sugar phosphate isomerase/epimerase